ncbi:MAG: hypothetical protein M1823_006687, partial [Watsoniomyces obsoletus]
MAQTSMKSVVQLEVQSYMPLVEVEAETLNEGGYTAYYLSVRRGAADVLEIFHELRSMSAEDKRELATVIGSDEAD